MLGVAQLKLVASFVTTAIQVYAFTSALEKMSQRTVHTEELKFNRTEAIRLAEKEERREEVLRREGREDRFFFLSVVVLACIVYYLKN